MEVQTPKGIKSPEVFSNIVSALFKGIKCKGKFSITSSGESSSIVVIAKGKKYSGLLGLVQCMMSLSKKPLLIPKKPEELEEMYTFLGLIEPVLFDSDISTLLPKLDEIVSFSYFIAPQSALSVSDYIMAYSFSSVLLPASVPALSRYLTFTCASLGLPFTAIPAPVLDPLCLDGEKSKMVKLPKKKKVVAASDSSNKKKDDKKDKKDKKEKKKEKKEKKPSSVAYDASELDIRIGKILEAKPHPHADKLMVETIDFGEESGPRTVCSGVRDVFTVEQLSGLVCVVVNLKPVNQRKILSCGMLLVADDGKGQKALLRPQGDVKIGTRVTFEGIEQKELKDMPTLKPGRPKYDTVICHLCVAEGCAAWKTHKFMVDGKCVKTEPVLNGTIA
ncbi:hypothetical protein ADUPG1_009749 [Aduncisulcus paluster]|uniref:tRNA-binding domain-containing protein n=1 Tax=Aduncisulcus paluster TaxID=2918883 RepID=A0ABQ5KXT3_9EUKA|nr:hypothetical protein ADUPG1_009749 [Aduncisulcus paluster]